MGYRLLLIVGGIVSGTVIALLFVLYVLPTLPRKGKERIGLSEVPILRERLDNNPESLFMYDDKTSYRLKPSFVGKREHAEWSIHRTNSVGTLGDEIDPNTRIRKIVFLGDSVTYGSGVALEDTFSYYVQRKAGPDIQIVNAGTPGWSTKQELNFYGKYLSRLRPTAVLQVFCLNDLVDYEWVWDGQGNFTMAQEIKSLGGFYGASTTVEGLKIEAIRLHFTKDSRLAPLADMLNVFLKGWDPSTWDVFEQQIFHPPLSDGTLWIVVYIPTYNQLASLELGASEEEVCFPQKMLSTMLKKRNISFLDLTDALFVAKVANRRALYTDSIHLSSLGHKTVGVALEEALSRIGVLSHPVLRAPPPL